MWANWHYFWNWPQQSPHTQGINAGTQIKDIIQPGQIGSRVNKQAGASYTVSDADRGQLLVTTNAGGAGVALPAPGTLTDPASFLMFTQNLGAAASTFTPGGGALIDGLASVTFAQFHGGGIWSDGTDYFTMRG